MGSRVPASKRRQEAAKNKALTKEDMEFIDAVYNKYDINKDGELATSELKKLLTDLNDGHGDRLASGRLVARRGGDLVARPTPVPAPVPQRRRTRRSRRWWSTRTGIRTGRSTGRSSCR